MRKGTTERGFARPWFVSDASHFAYTKEFLQELACAPGCRVVVDVASSANDLQSPRSPALRSPAQTWWTRGSHVRNVPAPRSCTAPQRVDLVGRQRLTLRNVATLR